MTTHHMEINQDEICPNCGKGGAVKTKGKEYGLCLKCVNKKLRGLGMVKTIDQIKAEVDNLLNNYSQNIKSAFEKSGYALKLNIKIELESLAGEICISPTIAFYPEPQTKSEKYTVKVNEKQLSIAGME